MSDKEELPEWMTYDDDGNAIVKLSKQATVGGVKVPVLCMREPSVNDQLTTDARKGSEQTKEIAMFADLCGVTPEDVKLLSLRDYSRLQRAFVGFID